MDHPICTLHSLGPKRRQEGPFGQKRPIHPRLQEGRSGRSRLHSRSFHGSTSSSGLGMGMGLGASAGASAGTVARAGGLRQRLGIGLGIELGRGLGLALGLRLRLRLGSRFRGSYSRSCGRVSVVNILRRSILVDLYLRSFIPGRLLFPQPCLENIRDRSFGTQ